MPFRSTAGCLGKHRAGTVTDARAGARTAARKAMRQFDVHRVGRQVDLGDPQRRQRHHGGGAIGIGDQHLELRELRVRRRQLAIAVRVPD